MTTDSEFGTGVESKLVTVGEYSALKPTSEFMIDDVPGRTGDSALATTLDAILDPRNTKISVTIVREASTDVEGEKLIETMTYTDTPDLPKYLEGCNATVTDETAKSLYSQLSNMSTLFNVASATSNFDAGTLTVGTPSECVEIKWIK